MLAKPSFRARSAPSCSLRHKERDSLLCHGGTLLTRSPEYFSLFYAKGTRNVRLPQPVYTGMFVNYWAEAREPADVLDAVRRSNRRTPLRCGAERLNKPTSPAAAAAVDKVLGGGAAATAGPSTIGHAVDLAAQNDEAPKTPPKVSPRETLRIQQDETTPARFVNARFQLFQFAKRGASTTSLPESSSSPSTPTGSATGSAATPCRYGIPLDITPTKVERLHQSRQLTGSAVKSGTPHGARGGATPGANNDLLLKYRRDTEALRQSLEDLDTEKRQAVRRLQVQLAEAKEQVAVAEDQVVQLKRQVAMERGAVQRSMDASNRRDAELQVLRAENADYLRTITSLQEDLHIASTKAKTVEKCERSTGLLMQKLRELEASTAEKVTRLTQERDTAREKFEKNLLSIGEKAKHWSTEIASLKQQLNAAERRNRVLEDDVQEARNECAQEKRKNMEEIVFMCQQVADHGAESLKLVLQDIVRTEEAKRADMERSERQLRSAIGFLASLERGCE